MSAEHDWVVDEFCNSVSEFSNAQLARVFGALQFTFEFAADPDPATQQKEETSDQA